MHAASDAELAMDAESLDATSMELDAGSVDGAAPADAEVDAHLPGQSLTLQTAEGALQGKLEYGARLFLGIPFAEPPVGELRFAAPRPAKPWTGTRMAKEYGMSCIQPDGDLKGPFSEDCLTLNVTTPEKPNAAKLPVMVFIHGGGVMGGGRGYPSHWLSVPFNVVVVTINYRLGALGFMAHPALDKVLGESSGNMGLRDQQQALRWIRDNISTFGGDPENVTVFGESFGSMSTCYHIFASGSEGLARRYIMQSGGCVDGMMAPLTRAQIVQRSEALIERTCLGDASAVSCLRKLASNAFTPSLLELLDWRPHVDGAVLVGSPRDLLDEGKFARGEILVGSNLREWRVAENAGFPRVGSLLEMRLAVILERGDEAEALLAFYLPAKDADAHDAYVRLQSDGMHRCPGFLLGQGAAAQGRSVYIYRFDVAPAVHAQELDYVFGWPSGGVSAQYPGEAPIPSLPVVVDAMQHYWTNFARAGNPNDDRLLSWPVYTQATPQRVHFADPLRVLPTVDDDAACALWKGIYARAAAATL